MIEQYKQSTGIKNVDTNSAKFIDDFSNWIKQRQILGRTYVDFLDYMEFHGFEDISCAEVGKGSCDTVVSDLNTAIITPQDRKIEQIVSSGRIITGNMRVYNGIPTLISVDVKGKNVLHEIPSDYIRTYMTQNPYSPFIYC